MTLTLKEMKEYLQVLNFVILDLEKHKDYPDLEALLKIHQKLMDEIDAMEAKAA